jgi:hypothetical protein
MALSYTTTLRNNRLDEIATLINAGVGAGLLKIYSGTVPANVGTALGAQVLLATLTLTDPVAAAASSGVLTFSTITQDSSADATGTAAFFRLTDSDGHAVVQGTVGTSGADLNLTSTSIVATEPVAVTSFTITEGNT